jgi:hypothetical protein
MQRRVVVIRTWGHDTRAARWAERGWSEDRAVTVIQPAQKRVSWWRTWVDWGEVLRKVCEGRGRYLFHELAGRDEYDDFDAVGGGRLLLQELVEHLESG